MGQPHVRFTSDLALGCARWPGTHVCIRQCITHTSSSDSVTLTPVSGRVKGTVLSSDTCRSRERVSEGTRAGKATATERIRLQPKSCERHTHTHTHAHTHIHTHTMSREGRHEASGQPGAATHVHSVRMKGQARRHTHTHMHMHKHTDLLVVSLKVVSKCWCACHIRAATRSAARGPACAARWWQGRRGCGRCALACCGCRCEIAPLDLQYMLVAPLDHAV